MEFPKFCPPYMANDGQLPSLERFQAKHALGFDPGVDTGSREENASKQKRGGI
jgi:hypothetical protein